MSNLQKKTTLTFTPSSSSPSPPTIKVNIEFIDDDPGAVQSGHYLWPASSALSQYIVDQYCSISKQQQQQQFMLPSAHSTQSMIELGAGCGLVSLVALQIFTNIKYGVITDHDPGTLQRAKDNYEATFNDSMGAEYKKEDRRIEFIDLEWGDTKSANNLIQHSLSSASGFDLVLGSDLIYCREVVYPLLLTASCLMKSNSKNNNDSKFLLSQSFSYDDDTEKEIDNACVQLGLLRSIIICNLDDDEDGGVRIQIISKK